MHLCYILELDEYCLIISSPPPLFFCYAFESCCPMEMNPRLLKSICLCLCIKQMYLFSSYIFKTSALHQVRLSSSLLSLLFFYMLNMCIFFFFLLMRDVILLFKVPNLCFAVTSGTSFYGCTYYKKARRLYSLKIAKGYNLLFSFLCHPIWFFFPTNSQLPEILLLLVRICNAFVGNPSGSGAV